MTGNVEALLPGVTVLFDTDDKWAQQPLRGQRGVVIRQFDAGLVAGASGLEYSVCVGPCGRPFHDQRCHSAVAFRADELLLVPAEATS